MEESCKQNFIYVLLNFEKKENHFNVMSRVEYNRFIDVVEEAKTSTRKTSLQYRRLKRFDIVEVGGVKKLVSKGESVKYFLPVDEIFDAIESIHVAVEHGGRDRMKSEISRKYANITTEMINIFLSMCEICQQKKKRKKKSVISRPLIHSELFSRCQIDLIDMHSKPDHQYKFIMIYEDLTTKFILLKALKSKISAEIAYQLIDIFLTFGAPSILHSNSGTAFINSVIKKMTILYPELKLIPGNPKYANSQNSVEKAKDDIKTMLATWMKDNQTSNWSNGLRHIQFTKNKTFNSNIKHTPYKAMFGIEPRMGLTTTMLLPEDLIKSIHNEDDLNKIMEGGIEKRKMKCENGEKAKNDRDGPTSPMISGINNTQDNENPDQTAKKPKIKPEA